MDLEDIHPVAAIAGLLGGVIGYIIVARMSGADYSVGIVWRILTPIACAGACFLMVQKMAE